MFWQVWQALIAGFEWLIMTGWAAVLTQSYHSGSLQGWLISEQGSFHLDRKAGGSILVYRVASGMRGTCWVSGVKTQNKLNLIWRSVFCCHCGTLQVSLLTLGMCPRVVKKLLQFQLGRWSVTKFCRVNGVSVRCWTFWTSGFDLFGETFEHMLSAQQCMWWRWYQEKWPLVGGDVNERHFVVCKSTMMSCEGAEENLVGRQTGVSR